MKKFVFFVLFLTFHFSSFAPVFTDPGFLVFAQQPTLEWVARYITLPGHVQYISDVATDSAGNTYISGYIWRNNNSDSSDCVTLKINFSGVIEWAKLYNGEYNSRDRFNAIALDKHGNVYLTGFTVTQNTYSDYLTIKYNNSGDSVWTRKYNAPDSISVDAAQDISVDDSGNVYVTGYAYQNAFSDFGTVKYDSSGNFQWVRYYGTGMSDIAKNIAVDKNGDIIVTGNIYRTNGVNDAAALKYNSAGTQIWAKIYTGLNNQGASVYGKNLLIDELNNFYFTVGSSVGYFILKYNILGDTIWVKNLSSDVTPPPGNLDFKHLICLDIFTRIYTTGTGLDSNNRSDCVTAKYDTLSNLVWKRNYAGSLYQSFDVGQSIAIDKYSNVYATGYNDSLWLFNNFLTLKYDNLGVLKWAKRYDFAQFSDDRAFYICLDTMNNVYVTGITAGGGIEFGGNITVIKYSQPVGIKQISSQMPIEFKLFQNYPNPFNSSTKIRFSLPLPSKGGAQMTKLIVYDILGREVAAIVNEQLGAGTYEASFDASGYSSGVYFYRLIANDKIIDTKKLILLK